MLFWIPDRNIVCISRPRRFGKSMAADMLAAYYDRETDSRKLFEKYKIARRQVLIRIT